MTKIIYAVIDNHKKEKHTCYDFLYRTSNYQEFKKFIIEKGLGE